MYKHHTQQTPCTSTCSSRVTMVCIFLDNGRFINLIATSSLVLRFRHTHTSPAAPLPASLMAWNCDLTPYLVMHVMGSMMLDGMADVKGNGMVSVMGIGAWVQEHVQRDMHPPPHCMYTIHTACTPPTTTVQQDPSTCESVGLAGWSECLVAVVVCVHGVYGFLDHRRSWSPCSTRCPWCSKGHRRGHNLVYCSELKLLPLCCLSRTIAISAASRRLLSLLWSVSGGGGRAGCGFASQVETLSNTQP